MRIAISFVISLAMFWPAAAQACSCRKIPQTVEEHIEQNDVIFLGRAVGTHRVLAWDEGVEILQSAKFLISSALKSVEHDPAADAPVYVYVRHWRNEGDGANCGVTFVKGLDYRVFANSYRGKNFTSDCNFSRRESDPENVPWEEYRRAAGSE